MRPQENTVETETERRWLIAFAVVVVVTLAFHVAYRSRHVGGCDPSSYYLESLRLRGVDALRLDLSVTPHPPLAPLCMELHGDRVVSFFPPGFPALLAVFGIVGLEFHVTALAGAASAILLFLLVRARSGVPLGVAFATLWVLSPLSFFGSTQLMSDMPAAALGLAALFAVRAGRGALAGVLLGLAVGVRPPQLLLAPLLLHEARGTATRGRLAAALLLTGLAWACFLKTSTGSFRPPYVANTAELSGALLRDQVTFLVGATATLYAPVVLLALVGWIRRFRQAGPVLVAIVPYVALYSLWRSPLTLWWEARFLLPVLPLVHLAAAEGMQVVCGALAAVGRPLRTGLGALLVVGYGAWSLGFSPAGRTRTREYAAEYHRDALRVGSLVPRGALVGAVNHSGPLRLYTSGRVQSFLAWHAESPALVQEALLSGRPLYLLLTDDEKQATSTRVSLPPMDLFPVATLRPGLVLERAVPLANVLDVGTPAARAALGEGFGGDEVNPGMTFAWVEGPRAVVLPPPAGSPTGWLLSVHLSPFAGLGPGQAVTVVVAGRTLASFPLTGGYETVRVRIPGEHHLSPIELRFALARSPVEVGTGTDARSLAATVDWLAFTPAP